MSSATMIAAPDQLRRQADNLIVEEQQDGLEAVVLDAEGDRTEAVEQLCAGAR